MAAFLLLPSRPAATSRRLRRRPGRPLAALVPAVLLTLAMLLGAGGAATAHDELTGSNPAEGATVDVLPPSLELGFTSVPSGIGAQIQVLDESGADWADGPAEIVDRSATQPLRPGAPAGEYTVNWRVVSADSHPIEGSFAFTTQEGGATAPDTASTAGPLDVQDDQTQQAGVSDFPWSIVLMIAALVAIAVALAVTARKRLGAGK
ncbi:methionine-rich copper-binding protein CopC [Arthrobacter sp. CAN_A2]|uniref:copper resistance CopC family protein n=1 Tax=Arthrobacter sp. CAN_A2 TaxID=2787718 RepID=UPI0018EF8366